MKHNLNRKQVSGVSSFLIIYLTFIGFEAVSQSAIDSTEKPNIIVFMVDDMGWQDTSVPFWEKRTSFNNLYQTPNMERLANEGVKFTQAYATAVCSPTRVSFITGMSAARHRVTNWTLEKNEIKSMERDHPDLSFPLWNVNGVSPVSGDSLAIHATPLPQILKDHGYNTIHVGKAHFGAIETPGAHPLNLGFNVNIAGHAAGAPSSYKGLDNFGNGKEGQDIWAVPGLENYHGKDVFLTEALTREALKSMDQSIASDKPFFLYMAHYAVHTPIMADERFLENYLEKGMDMTEAKYAALIEGMDKSLGDILNFLEEKNIDDKTAILFMSDNGGLSAVARGGQPHTHNAPLSSGKGSAHEGGIRVPMIVKWNNQSQAGSTCDSPVIIEDFYPSILEMAGISTYPTVQQVDGISFMSMLQGEATHERELYWHYPNEWGPSGPGIGASSSVRSGNWKLIYYHVDQRMELFNLKQDISESFNLATTFPDKLIELAKNLSDFLLMVDAQMPSYKEDGRAVPYPIDAIR